jgi:YhcH/YjgK/YiaL family protein
MIVDQLSNASLYLAVHKRLGSAFDYLKKTDLSKVDPGTYEIDGRKVYVMVQQYETKPMEKGRWEAHRKYIDVQYVHQGVERFGYANLLELKPGNYDEAKDFLSLEGEGKGDFFLVRQGTFVILFLQDGHMPGMAVSTPQPVKKFVVKVAIGD